MTQSESLSNTETCERFLFSAYTRVLTTYSLHGLPFKSQSFDYIRLSRASMGIPCWLVREYNFALVLF